MAATQVLLQLFLATSATVGGEACPAELFRIARNTNANVVVYELRRGPDGALDAAEPVHASWIMLAEQGQREELGFFERTLAYGFALESVRSGQQLHLRAAPDRPVLLEEHQGCIRALTRIAGRTGVLGSIFVEAGSGLIPPVTWVELSGIDVETGEPLRERIGASR
jgi:hypothetical protein